MLSKRMQDALNGQINAEFYSAYLYLSMAAWLHNRNLPGSSHWMRIQAQEELLHAMKIYDYINTCSGHVMLNTVEAPPTEWTSPLAVFEEAHRHEQNVTDLINTLVELASVERDYATNVFLHWFVTEQIQEEASTLEIVQKLKTFGDSGNFLYILDKELSSRAV